MNLQNISAETKAVFPSLFLKEKYNLSYWLYRINVNFKLEHGDNSTLENKSMQIILFTWAL